MFFLAINYVSFNNIGIRIKSASFKSNLSCLLWLYTTICFSFMSGLDYILLHKFNGPPQSATCLNNIICWQPHQNVKIFFCLIKRHIKRKKIKITHIAPTTQQHIWHLQNNTYDTHKTTHMTRTKQHIWHPQNNTRTLVDKETSREICLVFSQTPA